MELQVITKTKVRFNETDPLGIVWHGNYVTYLEDGREAFGAKYKLDYLTIYAHKYATPIVKLTVEYKKPLRYGELVTIITQFIPTQAAKIIFKYQLYNEQEQLVCTAESVQAFVDIEGNLALLNPPFFEQWKQEMNQN